MFCTSCGKQIPDDSVFCPECGAPVQNAAPAVKRVAAPVAANGNLWIVGVVAAAIIFIAPLLPWVTMSVWGISESVNLFGMTGLDKFAAVIIMLLGLCLIAWNLDSKVPVIKDIKSKIAVIPFLELIVIGVVFIITIIAMIRKGGAAGEIGDFDDFGIKVSLSCGIGAWFCLIACIAAAVPSVLPMIQKKN